MNRNITILLLASLLSSLSAGLLGPLYAIFVESIGGDILDAGGAWAAFMFVTGIATIILGQMENLDKRVMVVAGFALSALGTGGYIFVQTPLQLFFVQAILGLAIAVITPPFDALYSISLEKGKESTQWSYFEGMTNIVLAVSALTGALIVQSFGFKILFSIMFLLSVASTVSALAIIKNPEVLLGLKPRVDLKKKHETVQKKISEYRTVLAEVKKIAPKAVEKAETKVKGPEKKPEPPKPVEKPPKTVEKKEEKPAEKKTEQEKPSEKKEEPKNDEKK